MDRKQREKRIKIRPIVVMLILQFILGYILLNTGVGNFLVGGFAKGFGYLLEYAAEGINFVFGGLVNADQTTFFMNVLLPIVFISALIGILQKWKILPFIIKYIGLALSKVNGMGRLESYNAVASAILGQSEVFISLKKELGLLNQQLVHALRFCDVNRINVNRRRVYDDAETGICRNGTGLELIWRFHHRFNY